MCIQCVVAGRPSSRPAAASTNAPVQIDISRARRPSRAAPTVSSSPPRSTAAPRWMPGTTTVSAVRRIDASYSGSTE